MNFDASILYYGQLVCQGFAFGNTGAARILVRRRANFIDDDEVALFQAGQLHRRNLAHASAEFLQRPRRLLEFVANIHAFLRDEQSALANEWQSILLKRR